MRRVICSAATGPHVEFLEITRPIMDKYAKRHGYDVVTAFPPPQDIAAEVRAGQWFYIVEHYLSGGESHLNAAVFMV